ncbi:MAG: hypothetical protein A2046_01430 [Bacteroidetes bacterium GWA2_30_7]|nr:MAG: hypothetical protein A2046_01430 [Bacteroidetes bacterium GWA2_30_7]
MISADGSINIIDPSLPVAKRLMDLLACNGLLNISNNNVYYNFFNSGNQRIISEMVNELKLENCKINFNNL